MTLWEMSASGHTVQKQLYTSRAAQSLLIFKDSELKDFN